MLRLVGDDALGFRGVEVEESTDLRIIERLLAGAHGTEGDPQKGRISPALSFSNRSDDGTRPEVGWVPLEMDDQPASLFPWKVHETVQ